MIRLLVPNMPPIEAAFSYLRRSEEARWWTNHGPCVQELERRLSEKYVGAYVVTCCSCTAGLELVYTHLMIRGYRAINLPALTFPATWLAANRSGLSINALDVDKDTWVAPGVSGFGLPTYSRVVDAAGAFGEQGVPLIPAGITVVFSLHATKPLGCGEGGFIVTWDAEEAEALRRMANFGIWRDGSGISRGMGWNAKMSEFSAAMALASLDAWSRDPWLQLDGWYRQHLPESVVAQKRPPGVYPMMPVRLPVYAEQAQGRMADAGIETRRWYCPPMHRHPLFVPKGNRAQRRHTPPLVLPVTDHLAEHLLGLPWHLKLTEADVIQVCDTLGAVVETLK